VEKTCKIWRTPRTQRYVIVQSLKLIWESTGCQCKSVSDFVISLHVVLLYVDATRLPQVITTQRELTRTDEENRALTDLALRGLQLLSSWNVRIMELVICTDAVCRPLSAASDCCQLWYICLSRDLL